MFAATTISNCRRIVGALLLLLLSQLAYTRISLFANDQPLAPAAVSLRYCFDTSQQYNFNRYLVLRHQFAEATSDIDLSYREGMFWFTFDLAKLPSSTIDYLLLQNLHINIVGVWLVQNDSLLKEFPLTGDHLPFQSRLVYHPQFVFPLQSAYRKATLVLLVDKRTEQFNLPVHFFSSGRFIQHNRESNILTGLLTGICIFILSFTLFLYYNIKERIYVYYALYVLTVLLYILSDAGLSFLLFFPNHPFLSDLARPFLIVQVPVYYLLFARCLLAVEQHFPRLYRFTSSFLIFYVLVVLAGLITVLFTFSFRTFLLNLMSALMLASFIPILLFAVLSIRTGIRYAWYILTATVLLIVFGELYQFYLSGRVPDVLLTRYAVSIGFTAEIALLAFALSIRFRNYKVEAEKLLRLYNQQQENIFKNISTYHEKEMQRLSGLLHDSVGAGLSSVKYNLEAVENNPVTSLPLLKSTIADLTHLTDEIRHISHNLSPLLLQKKGIIKGLYDLTEQYSRTGQIKIYLESIGSLQTTSFQNEVLVFRIVQELVHNAIKHASATEIMIQLLLEPELVSLFVEDNGRGFDKERTPEGLGFSQIKELVTFVNGRFDVDSQVNRGCRISIEFPVIPHE